MVTKAEFANSTLMCEVVAKHIKTVLKMMEI